MGHAVHPNYTSKHEENHKPVMNGGIVLKVNAKQRYTTDAIGSFLVKKLVERKGGKVQVYEVRNDMSVYLAYPGNSLTDHSGLGPVGLPSGVREFYSFFKTNINRRQFPQRCSQKSVFERSTSEMQCSPCILFVRRRAVTMYKMQLMWVLWRFSTD